MNIPSSARELSPDLFALVDDLDDELLAQIPELNTTPASLSGVLAGDSTVETGE
jgi:hypothetical protein